VWAINYFTLSIVASPGLNEAFFFVDNWKSIKCLLFKTVHLSFFHGINQAWHWSGVKQKRTLTRFDNYVQLIVLINCCTISIRRFFEMMWCSRTVFLKEDSFDRLIYWNLLNKYKYFIKCKVKSLFKYDCFIEKLSSFFVVVKLLFTKEISFNLVVMTISWPRRDEKEVKNRG
jgi:hypothetical protein